MTAQKLTKSSSTDSFNAFKFQPKAHIGTSLIEPDRREREGVAGHHHHHHHQTELTDIALDMRDQPWRDAATNSEGKGDASNAAAAGAAAAPGGLPNKVEPDSHQPLERRTPAVVVAIATGSNDAAPAAATTTVLAIPVSPPSSPTHVAPQQGVATVTSTPMTPTSAVPVPTAAAAVSGQVKTKAATVQPDATKSAAAEIQQSPSGGAPAAFVGAQMPAAPAMSLPGPAMAATVGKEGGEPSTAGGTVVVGAGGSSIPAAVMTPVAPVARIKLGRGRKLCPNCGALTKSAVKQCRECEHVFNPMSSRLRPPPRETKENEQEPIPARRRLRPSQRFPSVEYELCEAPPGTTTVGGDGSGRSAVSGRRPLGASNAAGGVKSRGDSGVGVGLLAAADGAVGRKAGVSASVGGGSEAVQQQQQPPPKRSHKRKIPLPPGVSPPKRKKGAAAAARAQAQAQANTANSQRANLPASGAHMLLPRSSLPDRQRIAQDLLASPTPMVPTSPELIPAATPAGPLLFMPSVASLEDVLGWPATPAASSAATGAATITVHPLEQQAAALSLGLPLGVPLEPLPAAQHELEHQHRSEVSGGLVAELLLGEEDPTPPLLQRRPEDLIDLSAESQDRDPFEGVELRLGGGAGSGPGGGGGGGGSGSVPVGVPPTFSSVGAGGGLEQFPQRVFSLEETMELLSDTDGDLILTPPRAPTSHDGTANSGSGGGGSSYSSISNSSLVGPWPESSGGSSFSANTSFSFRRSGSSFPDNPTFPNFERGAALASAGAPPDGGSLSSDPQDLLLCVSGPGQSVYRRR